MEIIKKLRIILICLTIVIFNIPIKAVIVAYKKYNKDNKTIVLLGDRHLNQLNVDRQKAMNLEILSSDIINNWINKVGKLTTETKIIIRIRP